MTCLLACIARTWYGVQRFLVHLVLRPAVLLAMGLMWLVSCGRAAALVTTNPSILTQMPNTGHTIMSPNGNSVSVTQTFSPKQLEPDGEGDDLQAQTSTTPTLSMVCKRVCYSTWSKCCRQC